MNPLLLPSDRDHLDTKTVRLLVQGDVQLSPGQRAELNHRFFLHKMALRSSLVGFLVQDSALSDGTRLRMISNSGQHTVIVWPTTTINLRDLAWGVFCIPADTTHEYGWAPPAVEGENGTPATGGAGTRNKAGTLTPLKPDQSDADHAKIGKLLRFQSTVETLNASGINSDVILNDAFFEDDEQNNTSHQNWEHREWVAPDLGAVVTTYTGTVRVNGADMGKPYNGVVWACVFTADGTGGVSGSTLLAVSATGNHLLVSRKPVSGPNEPWIDLTDFILTDLDADAVVGQPNATDWILKVACNASGTVVSVWVQNPNAYDMADGGDFSFWVGIVDVDMNTGAATSTRATGEVVKVVGTGDEYAATGGTVFSGVRQISFEYDGDTKVFTELVFSGESQLSYAHSDGSRSYTYTETFSDSREVWLHRGADLNVRIAYVEVNAYSHAEAGSFSPENPDEEFGPGSANYSVESDIAEHFAELIYFGGKGNIHAVLERTQRRINSASSGGSFQGAGGIDGVIERSDLSWRHLVSSTSNESHPYEQHTYTLKTPWGDVAMGQNTYAGTSATSTGAVISPNWVVGTGGSGSTTTDSNPGNVQQWGAVSDFVSLRNTTIAPARYGHPRYRPVDEADHSVMNARVVKDFILLSTPKLLPLVGAVAPFQATPEDFYTYCTDADALAAFNVDASLGVLKGIRLK